MTDVLIALDGSHGDRDVTAVAGQLSTTTGASILVLLPLTARVGSRLAGFAQSEELSVPDAAEAYLDRVAGQFGDLGIPMVSVVQRTDDAAACIAAHAERLRSSLIMVSGAARTLRRSVAERLLRITSAPVLVVPPQPATMTRHVRDVERDEGRSAEPARHRRRGVPATSARRARGTPAQQ